MKPKSITISLLFLLCINVYSQQKQYKQRIEVPKEYQWDLTKIYSTWEAWEADLTELQQDVTEIQKYKGILSSDDSKKHRAINESGANKPEILQKLLDAKFNMSNKATKLYCYVGLWQAIDARSSEYSAKMQYFSNIITKVEQNVAWIDPELATLDKNKLLEWTQKYSGLKPYHHYLSDFFRQREHILPEDQQKLMSILSSALSSNQNIYNSLSVADIQFEKVRISTGEEILCNSPSVERFLNTSTNQNDRKLIGDSNFNTYIKNKNTFAEIYTGILKSRWATAQIYGYPSCLDYVLDTDSIPTSVYSTFLETAPQAIPAIQKYFQLRKSALSLDTLYKTDLNLGLTQFRKFYSYEQALEITKNALSVFGEDYGKMVDAFLRPGNVDVYPYPGKRNGAFHMRVPEVQSYLLLNFNETRANVFTLAHETGHAMHATLSNLNQPLASKDYPVFIAEVASIVNELALVDYLIKNAESPEERIDLINQEINTFFSKFFRIAQLSEFEYKAYKMVENDMPVNIESLSNMFDTIEETYYGDILYRDGNEKYGWFRTQHLYNKYFYLFQYATSYSAALSIFKNISNEPDETKKQILISKYLDLLKAGGKDYPINLLKLAGVDMTTQKPYKDAIEYLKGLVDLLELELKNGYKI
ncbi:MAG: oligoendopeptidase F family protein [Bacteroidetes bacterium]|nr:oligoendopeptidase F family protein [Bacteroidota bacterium]